jgi:integrase/recombinase XerC
MDELKSVSSIVSGNLGQYEVQEQFINFWLKSKSSSTQSAYKKDLKAFGVEMGFSPFELLRFAELQAVAVVEDFKSKLLARDIRSATVNRRLAALQSFFRYARRYGLVSFDINQVPGETVTKYRDTTGIDKDQIKNLYSAINRTNPQGVRDYAIFRLFLQHGLRRFEIAGIRIKDLDLEQSRLKIYGKGKGDNETWITVGSATKSAIQDWLDLGYAQDFLFVPLVNTQGSLQLTTQSLYNLTVKYCKAAGITKKMSPHRLRHSAITLALDCSDGDLRKVQKFSRHSKIETLLIYDDARRNFQAEISDLLDKEID